VQGLKAHTLPGSDRRVQGAWCCVSDFGSRICGLGLRIQAFWFMCRDNEFRDSGFGIRVSGFGFRVSGFRFRISGFGF